jgi:hypothetical protein
MYNKIRIQRLAQELRIRQSQLDLAVARNLSLKARDAVLVLLSRVLDEVGTRVPAARARRGPRPTRARRPPPRRAGRAAQARLWLGRA